MITMLQSWKGSVEVDGKAYKSIADVPKTVFTVNKPFVIKLTSKSHSEVKTSNNTVNNTVEHKEKRITVKKYMTQKAEPGFDFMEKWNKNIPMPLRTMTGWVEKETRGMAYMHLHGDIWAEKISTCMCCGRKLTNPVSQYFGIGPECGGHNYVNPFNSDEELREAVVAYKKKLQAVTWEGWVIKSAITEEEDV